MDIFAREQQVYDTAIADLRGVSGSTLETAKYKKIIDEYGKLLKQFKQYRQMTEETAAPSGRFAVSDVSEVIKTVHYDVLTGIYNEKYLRDRIERVLGTMGRQSDTLSLIKIDIDYFSSYNDVYGHSAGDECIRYIAEILKSCLFRGQDFVARSGGEEFAAILPHTPEDGARLVADRMLEEVRAMKIPHSGSSISDYVTVSIGLVTSDKSPGGWSPEDFFKRADEALDNAKSRGRNQYAFLGLSAPN
jgi:diguanylate cyclase (GGDEF)-like protein